MIGLLTTKELDFLTKLAELLKEYSAGLIHLVFSKLSNKLTCSYNTNVITHVDNLRQFT